MPLPPSLPAPNPLESLTPPPLYAPLRPRCPGRPYSRGMSKSYPDARPTWFRLSEDSWAQIADAYKNGATAAELGQVEGLGPHDLSLRQPVRLDQEGARRRGGARARRGR